jgi:hypothetical protein
VSVATVEKNVMRKMLTVLAAIVVLCMIALPGAVKAAQRGLDGVRNPDQYDFSARRYVRRYYRSPFIYRPFVYRPYYYARPYYYRPYYQPYVYVPVPPFPIFPFFW